MTAAPNAKCRSEGNKGGAGSGSVQPTRDLQPFIGNRSAVAERSPRPSICAAPPRPCCATLAAALNSATSFARLASSGEPQREVAEEDRGRTHLRPSDGPTRF